MSEPAEHYFGEGDSRLCWFEWGDPAGQAILLLHATGFHARCWDRVVAAFPAGHRVVAVDLPGHGRSAKPDTLADWSRTAEPLIALVEGLDLRNVIGAGHSMGGHCLVRMAARMNDRFARLVLIDPVIMDPALYAHAPKLEEIDPSANPVSRRRAVWDSPEQMFERLREHPSYAIWQADVLMDYCRHGLLPRTDGAGFALACPPILEASVYAGSLCADPYPVVAKVAVPVAILRAPPGTRDGTIDFTRSPTWPGLVERFADARDVYLPEFTHFMPMQDPARIAREILNTSPIS
ncbi:MAG: alpha/beta fold hydrolase [Parasphingopyxis sp.]|uniref:alpha/beta fold hydrolase n=1 Tax=Parasphingopyxis sp. TaxID=1920299 RepID=UPI003F9FAC34